MTQAESSEAFENLRDFVLGDDRDGTPIFSGRADELGALRQDLETRLRQWRDKKEDAWSSATWVFQGAPGAGKTALLRHLGKTLPGEYEEVGLQAARLQTAGSVDDWKEAVADALIPGAGADLLAQRQLSWGLSLEDIGFKRTRTGPMLTWGSLQRGVKSGTIVARPVLLLIDEVQYVEGEPGTGEMPQGKFLNELHENVSNLPIFPVYGGLAWSRGRIRKVKGPSRFAKGRVRTLAPLSDAECGELLRTFAAEFGIRASAAATDDWIATLAGESQGWPHHLHTHLQAIAGTLLNNGRDLDAIGSAERAAIGAEAKAARDEYYAALLDSEELMGSVCLAAVGASVVARSETPLQVADLGDRIQEISDRADRGRLRLPQGASGEDFAEAMVRAGLLHKSPGAPEALSVPIPSLPDYLLRCFGMRRVIKQGGDSDPGPDANPAPGS